MNTLETIQKQIADNPIILYMKGTPDFPQCGFSSLAVRLLEACEAEFAFINILEKPRHPPNIAAICELANVPQLYINGELVGGSDIMQDLYQQGELKKLVDGARK